MWGSSCSLHRLAFYPPVYQSVFWGTWTFPSLKLPALGVNHQVLRGIPTLCMSAVSTSHTPPSQMCWSLLPTVIFAPVFFVLAKLCHFYFFFPDTLLVSQEGVGINACLQMTLFNFNVSTFITSFFPPKLQFYIISYQTELWFVLHNLKCQTSYFWQF